MPDTPFLVLAPAAAERRVVVIGGGFAGVKAARILRRRLPRDWEVVLYNRENHMVFSPLLAEVAGASLEAGDIAAPLRQMLPGVRCLTEEVIGIDPEGGTLDVESWDGRAETVGFAHCLIACGNAVNLDTVPGMADHAFALKSVGDGLALRAHVIQQFERAEICRDPEMKRFMLTFIVVGGGFSGVEVAGEINDLARESCCYYQNVSADDIHVQLIHSRDQILPEISPGLREFASRKMRQRGIELVLDSRVAQATAEGVWLKGGQLLRGGTVVCTVGTTSNRIVDRMSAEKEKGRLLTEPDMRLKGNTRVWAVGDCANIINTHDGQLAPGTGQFAEREGQQVAENILRAIAGKPTRPFHFKALGQLCSIGGHCAVAEIMGVQLGGFFAWFVWRTVYLLKLPSWSRRFKVGVNWTFNLLFSRDLVTLRGNPTDRVSHAFYHPGDFVFHQGDPAASFYVIESGEAEVVRCDDQGCSETLAVLGPGAFFGEMALIDHRPRNASIRARTDLEVVVLGSRVFEQVTGTLKPLQDLLERTVSRRSKDHWQRLPAARALLAATTLDALLSPPPQPILRTSDSFGTVMGCFETGMLDFLYVTDPDSQKLVGIVTRTDLFRSLENGATRETLVQDVMTAEPVAVARTDSLLTATATMREHGLKSLPIVDDAEHFRLAGHLNSRHLVSFVLKSLEDADTPDQPPKPLASLAPDAAHAASSAAKVLDAAATLESAVLDSVTAGHESAAAAVARPSTGANTRASTSPDTSPTDANPPRD